MNWVKSCLALFGLAMLLLIGSCVLGFGALGAGFQKALDPHTASGRVERPEAEVKQAVYDYLDGATSGSFGSRARVDAMSDGTMRLLIGKAEPYDMTMSVAFEPSGSSATKVTATFDASRLAWSQPNDIKSTNFHRCIRDDFQRFTKRLHNGQDGSSLDLDDLIVRSRGGDGELRCDLEAPATTSADRSARVVADLDEEDARGGYSYTPPPPAFGKPDPRAGKPMMNPSRDAH